MGAEAQRTEGQATGEPGLRAAWIRGFPTNQSSLISMDVYVF